MGPLSSRGWALKEAGRVPEILNGQNGPVEFLNGPAGSLDNLVGSPNVLDFVGSTNGLDGSLIYLI